jgi:hypothetical protein
MRGAQRERFGGRKEIASAAWVASVSTTNPPGRCGSIRCGPEPTHICPHLESQFSYSAAAAFFRYHGLKSGGTALMELSLATVCATHDAQIKGTS